MRDRFRAAAGLRSGVQVRVQGSASTVATQKVANHLDISVDRSSPVPLYHQVVQGIEAAIHGGVLPPGSRSIIPADAGRLLVQRLLRNAGKVGPRPGAAGGRGKFAA